MNFSRVLSLALCLGLAPLAGCGDPADAGASPITVTPLDQRWALDGVGAWRVPVSIGVGADASRQISAGSLTLRPDWTWEVRYEYRDLSANADTRGTHVSSGTYTARAGDPSTFDLHNPSTGTTSVATVLPDGGVALPLGGLRYHFIAAQ